MAKDINLTDYLCIYCDWNFRRENYNVIDNTYYCPECKNRWSAKMVKIKHRLSVEEIEKQYNSELKDCKKRYKKQVKNLKMVIKNKKKIVFDENEKGLLNDDLVDAIRFIQGIER